VATEINSRINWLMLRSFDPAKLIAGTYFLYKVLPEQTG